MKFLSATGKNKCISRAHSSRYYSSPSRKQTGGSVSSGFFFFFFIFFFLIKLAHLRFITVFSPLGGRIRKRASPPALLAASLGARLAVEEVEIYIYV